MTKPLQGKKIAFLFDEGVEQSELIEPLHAVEAAGVQTDLRNAGANWVDEQVHVDGGLVSSRKPDHLPAFCEKLVAALAQGFREFRQVA
jgi:putative intracellular protease/amidase